MIIAITAFWSFGLQAIPTALIFMSFAMAKAVRMLVSTASRDTVLQVGAEMDRDEEDARDGDTGDEGCQET